MKSLTPFHSSFPPLTCADLIDDAELAPLVVLASAIEVTIEALYAVHPALAGSEQFCDEQPPSFWIADAIVNQAAALKGSIDTYRHVIELLRADAESTAISPERNTAT